MTTGVSSAAGRGAGGGAGSAIFLMIAVGMGVVATVLAFVFINSAGNSRSAQGVPILVARRNLPVNTTIDPDRDLKVENIPVEFDALRRLTLDSAAVGNYKGEKVNRDIPAGQPVFLADLAAYGALELKEPWRALPIQAEPGIAIPGDYVKILIARPDVASAMAAGADASRAPYVANYAANGQAFRIIAVGGSLFKTRAQVMASEAGSGSSAPKVVTLEVTDAEATDILSALGSGMQRATLVICPPPAAASAPAGNGTRPGRN